MIVWYLLACLFLTVWGRELSVPVSWANSTLQASREQRINRTAAAIDAYLQSDKFFTQSAEVLFNDLPANNSWPYGNLLDLLADFDIFTNQTRYKEVALNRYLPALESLRPDLRQVSPNFHYAHAATRAYLAYKEERFLRVAIRYWDSSEYLTISEQDVKSGTSPAKPGLNSTIFLNCTRNYGNFTLAGGTFHSGAQDSDLYITLASTANHLTLAVALADIVGNLNLTYGDSAKQQVDFMVSQLYYKDGAFNNYIRAEKGCIRNIDSHFFLSDAGSSMQALSSFALTSKNTSLTDRLRDMAQSATLSKDWNSPNGILSRQSTDSTDGDDGNPASAMQVLLRSYHDLAVNDTTVSDLKTYLRAYLAVQYNSLVNRATFTGGAANLYGKDFVPGNKLDPDYQILAITTLLGGVISGDPDSDSATPNDPPVTEVTNHRRAPVGAIAGGAVGGVVLVLVIAGGYYYYRRRHRRQLQSQPILEPSPGPEMDRSSSPPPALAPQALPFRSEKFTRWATPSSPGITASTHSTSITHSSDSQSSRVEDATTEELVAILNQRLRNDRWNANESPPEYSKGIGRS